MNFVKTPRTVEMCVEKVFNKYLSATGLFSTVKKYKGKSDGIRHLVTTPLAQFRGCCPVERSVEGKQEMRGQAAQGP